MDEWRKYLPIFVRWFRAVMLYPCFLLIWVFSMLLMAGFRTEESFMLVAAALWMPFIFFSVARVFAESDDEGNLQLCTTQTSGFFARVGTLLRTPFFWIDAGFVLGFFLILPAAAAFYHVDLVLLSGFSTVVARLLLCAIGLPLLLSLMLLARLSAWQKYEDGLPIFAQPQGRDKTAPDMMMATLAQARWGAHSMGMGMTVANDSVETLSSQGRAWLRREKQEKHFALQLLGVALIYIFGGFALYVVVPMLFSFWRVLVKIGSLRWWLPAFFILLIVGGFWTFFALRALRIRRRFVKNLKRLCAEYGFKIEWMKRRYASLFHYRHGANFRLHANGKTYDCKFFGAMRRHWDMYFHENGTLKTRRAIRFRRVELFCFTSEYDFSFESDHVKICIVAPVPKTISAGNEHWNRPIDTGTKVGEYRIFSSTGFLNALRRDCVEKDK